MPEAAWLCPQNLMSEAAWLHPQMSEAAWLHPQMSEAAWLRPRCLRLPVSIFKVNNFPISMVTIWNFKIPASQGCCPALVPPTCAISLRSAKKQQRSWRTNILQCLRMPGSVFSHIYYRIYYRMIQLSRNFG